MLPGETEFFKRPAGAPGIGEARPRMQARSGRKEAGVSVASGLCAVCGGLRIFGGFSGAMEESIETEAEHHQESL